MFNSFEQFFFLDDYNNINKIMLQNTVLEKVRYENKIVIAITFSNIAFILFQSNRIAYSRFKIFLNIIIQIICNVFYKTDFVKMFIMIKIIF